MKTASKIAAFFAAVLIAGQTTQASEEALSLVIGHMKVETPTGGSDVMAYDLRSVGPKTLEIAVPPEAAARFSGFRLGFGISPIINDFPTTLSTIRTTETVCRVSRLNVLTGIETLVDNGEVIPVIYTHEQNPNARPAVSMLSGAGCSGITKSVQGSPIATTTVTDAGTLLINKQRVTWGGSTPAPGLNEGIVIRWTVRYTGTKNDVTYNGEANVTFVYKVVDLERPTFVSMTPPKAGAHGNIKFRGGFARFATLKLLSANGTTWLNRPSSPDPSYSPTPVYLPAEDVYMWSLPSSIGAPPKLLARLEWSPDPQAIGPSP